MTIEDKINDMVHHYNMHFHMKKEDPSEVQLVLIIDRNSFHMFIKEFQNRAFYMIPLIKKMIEERRMKWGGFNIEVIVSDESKERCEIVQRTLIFP